MAIRCSAQTRAIRLISFFLASFSTLAPAETRYAVLVGIEDYQSDKLRTPLLKYPVEDVTELADLLKPAGYQITLLTDETGTKSPQLVPSRANVEAAIKTALRSCKRGDTVLVALTGHGVEFNNEAYFCAEDSRPFADETKTLVSISGIYREMEKSFAGVKLMLVDACRNDPDPTRGRSAGVTAANATPPRGVGVLFSCSPGQRAFEHDELKHGIFFHYVLERLRTPGTSGVSVYDLAQHVSANVPLRAPQLVADQQQSPNLRADLFGTPPMILPRVSTNNELVEQVDTLLKRGQFSQAMALVEGELRKKPNAAVVLALRGTIRSSIADLNGESKYHKQAEEDFDAALKLDPNCAEAWLGRSHVRSGQGRFDDALSDVNQAIRIAPLNVRGLIARSWIYDHLDRDIEMDYDVSRALTLDPRSADALNAKGTQLFNRGQFEEGLVFIDQAIQIDPNWGMLHNNRAYGLSSLDREAEAKQSYERAKNLANENIFLWTNWLAGVVAFEDTLAIEKALSSATAQFPDSPAIYKAFLNAVPVDARGEYSDSLEKALTTFPNDPGLLATRSVWRLNQGEDASALEDASKAIQLDPKNTDALRARVTIFDSQGDLEHMLADIRRIRVLTPDDEGVMSMEIYALGRLKRTEEAKEAASAGLKKHPESVDLLSARGYVRFLEEDFSGAIADSTRVLESEPKSREALELRFYSLYSIQQYEKSLVDVRSLRSVGPDSDDLVAMEIEILTTMNRKAEASKVAEAGIEKFPNSQELVKLRDSLKSD